MQEINELKNLVIQSLEGNGTLGQIRAQIRASVFKIIEMQETQTKKNVGFHWENPLCQTIYDNKEGKIAVDLINDFLEFFKMDYTQSVFGNEANLQNPASRDELQKKLGVKGDANKPVLFHIIAALLAGGGSIGASAPSTGITINKENQHSVKETKQENPLPSLSKKPEQKLPGLGSLSNQQTASSSVADKKPAATFNEPPKKQVLDTKKNEPFQSYSSANKGKEESDDEYGEEVFENVEEELVEDLEEEDPKHKDRKSMMTSSEDIIGASQSQGFDVSVDSLALEDYDYFENAERKQYYYDS